MITYINPTHLQSASTSIGKIYKRFQEFGYGDLNVDALWKWSAIIAAWNANIITAPQKVVEIAEGYSPLHHFLSWENKVTCVSPNFNNTWFPVKDKKYINAQETPTIPENITYVEQDISGFLSSLEPESVDAFIDASTLIHLNKQNKLGWHNDGCVVAAQYMFTALKPGGLFFTACDVKHPYVISQQSPEWMTGPQIVECFSVAGFEPIAKPNYSIDPFYLDYTKATMVVDSNPPHTKLTTLKTGLPIEKLLMREASDGTPLMIGLFCFKKL